jgi:hypothetical protein
MPSLSATDLVLFLTALVAAHVLLRKSQVATS